MREVIHWPAKNRLVYLDEKAKPAFWDERWCAQGAKAEVSRKDYVVVATRRYLPLGSRILDGGCGPGGKVRALAGAGYRASGIDFAPNTVSRAKLAYPMLDIQLGDVRKLPFEKQTFDGYWSIGVIEHFWSGYDDILAEAARVLKTDGYLFLSTPWFSPYRKWKAIRGGYPEIDFSDEPEAFYQFALSRQEIEAALEKQGFQLQRWTGLFSDMCMLEDMMSVKTQITWLLKPGGSLLKRFTRRFITELVRPFCGHSYLAVAQRKGQ